MVFTTNRKMAMTALRRRMLEDLQLRGLAPRTQPCDVEAVKPLTPHDRRAPDQISEDELRQSFLFLINDQKVAERTCRMHRSGIRCFYERTLQRPWPVVDLVRPRNIPKLPVVLSLREVRSLLALVEHPKARMCVQSTTPAATAVAPRVIAWTPKLGRQSGGRHACRSPTFMSS
jgi:integrase/recombinase XerD